MLEVPGLRLPGILIAYEELEQPLQIPYQSCWNGEEMKEKVVLLRELDRAIIYNEWSF
jgi:hypothetical protein